MADEDDRNFSQYIINYVLKDWVKRQADKKDKD